MDPLVVGALVVVTVGVCVGYWLMTRAKRVLGEPQLQVAGRPYGLGDVVSCRLSSQVRSNVKVEQVTLGLECQEIIRWTERVDGTDPDGRAKSNLAHRERWDAIWTRERRFAVDRELQPGEPLEASADPEVPAEGVPTFVAEHNEIRWLVTFRVSMPAWPDLTGSSAIVVEPRRCRAAAARA